MLSSVYRDNLIDYNKLKFVLNLTMKKLLIFLIFTFTLSSNAISKETTYKKELFDKALLEGKVVVVSSWIKYCTSCASQMKILNKAKKDFNNIEYFTFDVTNKEIAKL